MRDENEQGRVWGFMEGEGMKTSSEVVWVAWREEG